jgi:aryl-alcohol dehydrogenase-like predicted oxidoreductase
MDFYNKIGLGTAQFGMDYGISNYLGRTSSEEVSNILKYSKQIGIDTIDTASSYNTSENVLGENDLNGFKIISKFMPISGGITIKQQFDSSITKLKVKNLYAYLAHRPQDLIDNIEQWNELIQLKNEGKVIKIGFSLNTVGELNKLMDLNIIPDLVQVPYNYFDNRFKDSLSNLKKIGCEIHVRSSFLQGLFFVNPNDLPPFFEDVKIPIKNLQNEFGTSLASVLLKYVLKQNFIDKVIIGVENRNQLVNNLTKMDETVSLSENKKNISEQILMPSMWPKTK